MDSGDISLPTPSVSGSSAVPAPLPLAQSYPSPARPATVQPAPAHPSARENPFGTQHGGRDDGYGPVKNLRKRIGSVFAGLIALIAKFGVALKALLVALP